MTGAALSARVVRLERAAARDRVLALGVLALALVTAQAPASSSPRTVRAAAGETATLATNGLSVRDRAHTLRTSFGLDKDRYPALAQFDTTGALRQSMNLVNERPVFRQFDRAGKRRAEMFLTSETQNGEFVLRDASEVRRAAVYIGNQGLPEIAFSGSDAKVRAYLSTDDVSPYLVMKDRGGTSRVVIGGYESGKIGMDLRNASGGAIWSKP